ncbi:MAG: DUF1700 domain-containing protein [Clostridia bacterium]|nr:DUF1700 domain-containing protein [Clostridia bacterium]
MNKEEFLAELERGLSGLPKEDVDGRLEFYGEMIDDRKEEGVSEEEAVAELGPVENVVEQIVAETPFAKIVKEKIKPKRELKGWEIALIIIAFPVWLPLLISAAAVIFSLYVTVWSLIVSLWAVEVSFIAASVGCVAGAVVFFIQHNSTAGIAMIGAGIFCAGLSLFMFFGCVAASRGILRLTKKAILAVKSRFVGKESEK